MKEMRDGCNIYRGPHPSSECDDKPIGGPKEEKSNHAYGGYPGNYYGMNSKNWHDRQPRDDNRNSQPREDNPSIPLTPKKKFDESDFEKTMREFMHVNVVFTWSGKTYDPPINLNANTTIIYIDNEDEADEAEKEVEPSSFKQTKTDPSLLKAIDVPLVDVLAGMPIYEKFLKDLVSNKKFNALLDDFKPFLSTSEKINETSLDKEFEEFMAVEVEEIPKQEEEVKDNFEDLPLEENLRIKISIQDPPTDLKMKPLPKHLEYAFLEKDSLLPVVISALLKDDEKKRLVFILKNHKEEFAWKISDISGISPSFCKHKINFEDDSKPVIQRQCRLNPNMKEVVKKDYRTSR
ncbi:hypothetical protein Tco_1274970 [Tanacetum coccineum]